MTSKWLILMAFSLAIMSVEGQGQDTVRVPASTKYDNPSLLKKIILGRNYRKEWSEPVAMKVFWINREKGGMKVEELGGGMQTRSLHLLDSNGHEWALRSVDKDVEKAIPEKYRKTFFKKIVQDMVSAAHPYAALTIPTMARATGVLTGTQELFFVPDDPALGEYRELFANTVCLLEQRTLINADTEDTEEVLEEIVEENDHHVIQKALLKARLLDMLIGDWDRHEGQWKWAKIGKGENKTFFAIPRDRDQAYFNSDGILVKLAALRVPHWRGFKEKSNKLKQLNYKSWDFDATFLNELDRKDWEEVTRQFQNNLTDEVVSEAIKQLPPEIYTISGEELASRIRSRRDGLLQNVMKYYEFLSKEIQLYGTDEAEYFHVKAEDNSATITIFSDDEDDRGRELFRRTFVKEDTRKIYLNGLGENDRYTIEGKLDGIRLIIDGGQGQDAVAFENPKNIKLKEQF